MVGGSRVPLTLLSLTGAVMDYSLE
jgi:hypothetical protein